ncbi:hypothetical protein [Streptomyces sp. NRRL F-3273]|uniref:hypothetical protein n=1 Tax=Streptomyces sp. NRRL F-3273 TaxID=1463848 RepID=UPI002D219F9F|nr:hypothetical protein [Streptomyces sp. NRRL F-3273]
MATQHLSPVPPAPVISHAYPMAKPGYGKRNAPDQRPPAREDFALLPARERYVAGFIDRLPQGAAMSVKQLAKHLPLYGQQAIGTSLNRQRVVERLPGHGALHPGHHPSRRRRACAALDVFHGSADTLHHGRRASAAVHADASPGRAADP